MIQNSFQKYNNILIANTVNTIKYILQIDKIGISLISDNTFIECKHNLNNYTRNELVYIVLELIEFYNETSINEHIVNSNIQFKIKQLEIDNEVSYKTVFPIMLQQYFENDKQRTNAEAEQCFINFHIKAETNIKEHFYKIILLEYLIQSFTLNIEYNIFNSILSMINNITTKLKTSLTSIHPIFQSDEINEHNDIYFYKNEYNYQWKNNSSLKTSTNIFIQKLQASSIQIIFSFINQQHDKIFEKILENNPIISKVLSLIGSVEKVSLNLKGCEDYNISCEMSSILSKLLNIYKQNLLLQFIKLFGYIELIGMPMYFMESFGTGMKEFFTKPAEGIVKGPLEGAKGFVDGSVSFIKNTINGTVNTTSKFTSSLSKGLLLLTQDDDYINKHDTNKITEKPSTVVDGFGYGIKSMAGGLFNGVADLIRKPIEGAKKNKLAGFGKGLLLGVGSVVAKPVSGVLDIVSKTTEGFKNMLMKDYEIKQKRIPRALYGKFKVVKMYNEFDAFVLYYLYKKVEFFQKNQLYYKSAVFYNNKNNEVMLLVFGGYEVYLIDYVRYELKTVLNYKNIHNLILKENKLTIVFNEEINGSKSSVIKFKNDGSNFYYMKVFELFQDALNEK